MLFALVRVQRYPWAWAFLVVPIVVFWVIARHPAGQSRVPSAENKPRWVERFVTMVRPRVITRWPFHRSPSGLWPQVAGGVIAVGAVMIAVAAAKSTSTTIRGVAYLHPDQSLLNFGVGAVIAGFALIAWLIILAIGRWIQTQISPLSLEFDPQKHPGCRESFPNGNQTRVRVEDRRRAGIERVRLNMERVFPPGYESLAHRIHDASENHQSSKDGYDLAPDEPIYFDIAFLTEGALILEFAEDHVRNMQAVARPIATSGLLLNLRATGWQDGWAIKPRGKMFNLTVSETSDLVNLTEIKGRKLKFFLADIASADAPVFSSTDVPDTAAGGPRG
jgi:hypothetical protein